MTASLTYASPLKQAEEFMHVRAIIFVVPVHKIPRFIIV